MDWSTLIPVGTLIAGSVLTMVTEKLRDRRQLAREQSARDAARETTKLDRREEFELSVLRDTHSAVTNLMRAILEIHLEGVRRYHRGGLYLPEEDAGRDQYERLRQKQGEFASLRGLILEVSIRDKCDEFQNLVTRLSIATSYDDGDSLLTELGPVVARVQDSVSARIRTLYKQP